jgi:hypothetical protein
LQCQKPGEHPDKPSNRAGGTGACLLCQRERAGKHRDRNRQARSLYVALLDRKIPADVERIAEGDRLLRVLDMARDPRIA